jgi:hypothetical protein
MTKSAILEDYPYCHSIITSGFPSLYSHKERANFVSLNLEYNMNGSKGRESDKVFVVENPVYTQNPKGKCLIDLFETTDSEVLIFML